MNDTDTELEKLTGLEVVEETAAGATLAEKPKVKPTKFNILGNIVYLDDLNKAIADARSEAGRVNKIASNLNLGTMKKNILGGGDLLPTLATVTQLAKAGKVNDSPAKSKAIVDQIKGLNLLIDGLALLGLASRKTDA